MKNTEIKNSFACHEAEPAKHSKDYRYLAPETVVCEIEEAALICVSGDGQNEGYDEYPINW